MYGCLSPALLPACHDIKQSSYQASELCGIYLRPANVDELHAAYFSMAFLSIFGIPKLHMLNTQGAVVFGMIYDFLPFMIMPIYNSIVRIRKETIDAARDLGANSFITFFRIILPLTVPGIISGIIMVFVPALTSFVISDLLGGGKVLLIGNVIEQSFMQGSYWNLGSGLSIVLMLFVLISMAFMNRAGESGGHAVW